MYAEPFAESLVSDRSPVMSGKARLSPEAGSELVSQLVFPVDSAENWVLISPTQTSDAGRTRSSRVSECVRVSRVRAYMFSLDRSFLGRRRRLLERGKPELSTSSREASLIQLCRGMAVQVL